MGLDEDEIIEEFSSILEDHDLDYEFVNVPKDQTKRP
jgi:hypothetical protein